MKGYGQWRKAVLARAGLRFDPQNGITLCAPCHYKVHKMEKIRGALLGGLGRKG